MHRLPATTIVMPAQAGIHAFLTGGYASETLLMRSFPRAYTPVADESRDIRVARACHEAARDDLKAECP